MKDCICLWCDKNENCMYYEIECTLVRCILNGCIGRKECIEGDEQP